MNRRDMLKAGVAAGALGLAPRLASAQVNFSPAPKGWRTFVLTDQGRADVRHQGVDPAADLRGRRLAAPGHHAPGPATPSVAERVRDPKYGAEMLGSNGRPTSRTR